MVATRELKELQIQKELLLAKSTIYRATFQLECQEVRAATAWIGRASNVAQRIYPLLLGLLPLCGLVLFRKKGNQAQSTKPRATKLLLAWDLYRKLWPLVRFLSSRKGKDSETVPAA